MVPAAGVILGEDGAMGRGEEITFFEHPLLAV